MEKTFKTDALTSFSFFALILFYISVTVSGIIRLSVFGRYAIIFSIVMMFILLVFKSGFKKSEILLYSPFVLLILIYILNIGSHLNIETLMTTVHKIVFLMIVHVIYIINWNKIQIKMLSGLYYLVFPLLLYFGFVETNIVNSNTIGGYAYFLSFFPLLYVIGYARIFKKTQILIILLMSILVILTTGTRSILLSVGFAIITILLWKIMTKTKFFFYLYFVLILTFNFFVVVVYPKLYMWKSYYTINDLSLKYTGKPIMTGRNIIWEKLLDVIKVKPLFGYGPGALPEHFFKTEHAAHNTYLQVSLQSGLVGLLLLLIFLFFIWKSFWNNRNDYKVMLASSFFISIMTYQLFETSLIQTNFGLGLTQWIIIGFGLSYALKSDRYIKEST